MFTKYPRTMHFKFSPGLQNDDRMLEDISCFDGKIIVVTEKLDGENTNLYSDHYHARSVEGEYHPSQAPVRALHGAIQHEIPTGWRICGENTYAKHSIFYDRLTSFFYVFSVWDEYNQALSWEDTKTFAQELNLQTVPELYIGPWNEEAVKACWTGKSVFGDEQEGYVVRNVESFHYDDFAQNAAKFVRKGHVQTNEFWKKTWIPNQLLKSPA